MRQNTNHNETQIGDLVGTVTESINEFNQYRAEMNERILSGEHLGIKRFFAPDHQAYEGRALDSKTRELITVPDPRQAGSLSCPLITVPDPRQAGSLSCPLITVPRSSTSWQLVVPRVSTQKTGSPQVELWSVCELGSIESRDAVAETLSIPYRASSRRRCR